MIVSGPTLSALRKSTLIGSVTYTCSWYGSFGTGQTATSTDDGGVGQGVAGMSDESVQCGGPKSFWLTSRIARQTALSKGDEGRLTV